MISKSGNAKTRTLEEKKTPLKPDRPLLIDRVVQLHMSHRFDLVKRPSQKPSSGRGVAFAMLL